MLARQAMYPAEVIVVDNGCNAADPAVPAGMPLTYQRAPVRCGAAQARNIGAAVATGQWLAFLDDDDTWCGDYLGAVQRAINADPRPRLMLGLAEFTNSRGRVEAVKRWDASRPRTVLWRNPGVVGSNIIIDCATFMATGGFDHRLACGEDRALLWRCLRADGLVSLLPEACARIQRHDGERLTDTRRLLKGKAHFAWLYRRDMRWRERLATLGTLLISIGVALRRWDTSR